MFLELSDRERLAIAILLACVLVLVPVALWRHGLLGFFPPAPATAPADQPEAPASQGAGTQPATRPLTEPGTQTGAGPGRDGAEPASFAGGVVVHVVGAVRCPGVYELGPGARVVDAVRAAGGESERAATWAINMAARVSDGDRVYVPTEEEVKEAGSGAAGLPSAGETDAWGAGSSTRGSPAPGSPRKVDINRASPAELDRVPGIGPTLAQRIVSYRQAHGPFTRVEDLLQVSGIGPRTLENMKDWLVVK